MDREGRSLTVVANQGDKTLALVWTGQTQFIEGCRFVTATEVAEGMTVAISYRTPFFGKPFLTKVVFRRSAGGTNEDNE